MKLRSIALVSITASALLVNGQALGATQSRAGTVTVVAKNLNNPRGVAFAHGHLYVAEAGTGGTNCPKGVTGPAGGPLCVGRTGSLALIERGVATPVLSNLISESDLPGGVAAEGIAAVAETPTGMRVLYGGSVVGLVTSLPPGVHLTARNTAGVASQLGTLTDVTGTSSRRFADVGDADFVWTAVHQGLVLDQFPDANPNALAVVGSMTYVADAGANTLNSVDSRGTVKELAFFPNPPKKDAVPTCVAVGPDHNLYVGQLAPGAPLNGGNVYKYNVTTGAVSVWKTGFNVVDGCGFDNAGNFYAVELQSHGFNPGPTGNPAGDVIKITPSGVRTVLGAGKLFFPQGFALDAAGNIYVSNWSIMTGTPAGPGAPTGQVVRISQ